MSRAQGQAAHESGDRPAAAAEDFSAHSLWQWVAIGLLLICWIAEAAMCADRGF